jgi:hypothetical protein
MESIFKFRFKSILVLLTFIGTVTFFSCKKEATVVACDTCARDKFLGTYSVTKGCTVMGIDPGDAINITAGAANNGLSLDGTLDATVSGSSFTIVKSNQSGAIISGSGNLSGSNLTMTITGSVGSSSVNCNLTLEKK